MRNFVLLSILGLTVADVSPEKQGDCLVDSGEAVSDAVDAALFIWAADKRCGKKGMEIKCEVDVTSAIKATNGMINVILKAVDKCHGLHTANKKCGLEAGKLSKHVAGLAASAGIVAQKCPKDSKEPAGMGTIAAPVMCTIDLKNTLKQLFKAVKHIRRSTHDCKESDKRYCAANALDIVSSFSAMGGYLAGAVGQCRRTDPNVKDKDTRTELCVQASEQLVHDTTEVAQSGVQMSQKCGGEPTVDIIEQGRLYSDYDHDDKKKKDEGKDNMNILLGALVPITAFVGFVGGRFFANQRAVTQTAREIMSDVE
jgi:hypothetical protein